MSQPTVRALALLEMLQARGPSSGAALAQTLKVDRRTLRRYIAMLEDIGIPIMSTQGRYGGYQLVPGFKLPPMMFTDDEALALSVGLLAVRGLSASQPSAAAESAQSKLERVLPAKLRARLGAIDQSITLELTQPIAALHPNVLARMTTAAQERVRVSLMYRTPQGAQTRREIDPYGLVYRAGRWYCVGMCHLRGGLRSFRLDRISDATLLAPRFDRPAGFDALEYLKASIATLPRAHTIEVLLETDLASAQRQLFSALGTLEWTGECVLLRSQADDLDWFARELSRLPFDFRVRSPRQLATAVSAAGRRLVRMARTGGRA